MLWPHRPANAVPHATHLAACGPGNTPQLCCGRDAYRWIVSAGPLLLASCSGPQSALDPAGRGAARIAALFWCMAVGAVIIWLVVVSLAVYAMRVRPKLYSHGRARLLIIGGGAVLPTVGLAGLLASGLP